MLSIILKILSILGILLLCLLGIVILLILLILFFPICYQISGKKNTEQTIVSARISWLFGLLRVRFDYPEPGRVLVKILPFTVYDSGKDVRKKVKTGKRRKQAEMKEEKGPPKVSTEASRRQTETAAEEGCRQTEAAAEEGRGQTEAAEEEGRGQTGAAEEEGRGQTGAAEESRRQTEAAAEEGQNQEADSALLKKIKKIKYTICSIYDKIKNIWENISYYMDLLREKETKELFSYVLFRAGKILKSIRPRRIRGQVLFGTGSPDTTGYAYGVYGMICPFLGSRLLVAPDFTQAILEGNIYIAGHITVFTILWNGLRVLLDKNVRRFIKKMKAGRKK